MKELEKFKQQEAAEGEGLSPDDRVLLAMNQEAEDQYLLDKLFIETGEDVEDLFIAFKYFKLM